MFKFRFIRNSALNSGRTKTLEDLMLEQAYDDMGLEVGPIQETCSLEEAGLEEATRHQPSHGFQGVPEYVQWWSDGEDSRYEAN